MENTTYLSHHGVLGQKWGVRRTETQLAKADRANSEAAYARKLATAYTKSIDKRAAKKPDSISRQTDSKNADGSLTAKGQKKEKKKKRKKEKKLAQEFYRKNRNEMLNKELFYFDEFDKTDYGKRLADEYKKQIMKMETTDIWENNKNDVESFSRAEEKYFRANGEYCARKLIEEYGQEKADVYANRGRIDTGKSAVEAMSDEWWVHAY